MGDILIVDDSDFDRKMIKMAISAKRDSLTFCEYESGRDIIDRIASDPPRIAILDIRMPGMDGFDILEAFRSRPELKDLPILMVSGSEQPEDREVADRKGANGYYVKPPSASAYFSLGRDIYDRYLCCSSPSSGATAAC